MTISGVSHYRGGTIDEVVPLAKALKAAYRKHGIGYRLSRFETGPNVGDWFVVVQFADQAAYEKAQAPVAQDPKSNGSSPRLQRSRSGLAARWSPISIFDAGRCGRKGPLFNSQQKVLSDEAAN